MVYRTRDYRFFCKRHATFVRQCVGGGGGGWRVHSWEYGDREGGRDPSLRSDYFINRVNVLKARIVFQTHTRRVYLILQ